MGNVIDLFTTTTITIVCFYNYNPPHPLALVYLIFDPLLFLFIARCVDCGHNPMSHGAHFNQTVLNPITKV